MIKFLKEKGVLILKFFFCIVVNFYCIKFFVIVMEDKIEVYVWVFKFYYKFMVFKVSRIYFGNFLWVVFVLFEVCICVNSVLWGKYGICEKCGKSFVSEVMCGLVLYLIGFYRVYFLFWLIRLCWMRFVCVIN